MLAFSSTVITVSAVATRERLSLTIATDIVIFSWLTKKTIVYGAGITRFGGASEELTDVLGVFVIPSLPQRPLAFGIATNR